MFPEYRELITKLKTSDRHFLHLFDKHNNLDQKIQRMEAHTEPSTQEEIEILKNLILHHLLLSSTATRRDLDDPATIQSIISVIPDVNTLELLHALSIADGEATGSAGWSDWKATLVNDLVQRVKRVMAGAEVAQQPEISEEQKAKILGGIQNTLAGDAVLRSKRELIEKFIVQLLGD